MLKGRLRRAAVAAFLEFLAAAQHTGLVLLEGPGELEAELAVISGNVTHAACHRPEGPALEGLEALSAILRWRYAYLEVFDSLPPHPPRTVTGTILHVMLEAARLEDEASRERELPPGARVRVRNNLSALGALAGPEMAILQKVKPNTTVGDLRKELRNLPVDSALQELAEMGLLELEGAARPASRHTDERQAILAAIVPTRAKARSRVVSRSAPRALDPLHETLHSLVDGERSGEDLRVVLNLSPGKARGALRALRAAGRIDY